MSHLPRLNRILNIIAKYRLDEFMRGQPCAKRLNLILLPYRLAGMFRTFTLFRFLQLLYRKARRAFKRLFGERRRRTRACWPTATLARSC